MAELQNFLLQYVVNTVVVSNSNSTDRYVQKQILLTLAVFYKRSKLDAIKPSNNESTVMPANMVKDTIDLFKSSDIKIVKIWNFFLKKIWKKN